MPATRMPTSDTAARSGPGQGVAVALTELRRSYGSIRALDGLTLDVRPGEVLDCSDPTVPARPSAPPSVGPTPTPGAGGLALVGVDQAKKTSCTVAASKIMANNTARTIVVPCLMGAPEG